MYDVRFINKTNYDGKPYRDPETGNLIEYCSHIWFGHHEYVTTNEYVANVIQEQCERLECIHLVCCLCGEVSVLSRDNIYTPKQFEIVINKSSKSES